MNGWNYGLDRVVWRGWVVSRLPRRKEEAREGKGRGRCCSSSAVLIYLLQAICQCGGCSAHERAPGETAAGLTASGPRKVWGPPVSEITVGRC
jgi:hypothetical protein